MSYRKADVLILERTPPSTCELCGKIAELRPYGPNGESICIDCASKDIEGTERRMRLAFRGVRTVVHPTGTVEKVPTFWTRERSWIVDVVVTVPLSIIVLLMAWLAFGGVGPG